MKVSRRDVLKIGGSVLIVMAGGGIWRAMDQGVFSTGQGVAYEPWENWRDSMNPLERIVAAGILASNPHNSQPWLFRIAQSKIELFADTSRQIGVIDPFLREMFIGLGCALENMLLASEVEGFTVNLSLMPDSNDETLVATLQLSQSAPKDSNLYIAIPNRHTNRGTYNTSIKLEDEVFQQIEALVNEIDVQIFWFKDEKSHQEFSQVALQATEDLIADEQQSMDSHFWWRHDWDELQEKADGLTLDAQSLGSITPIAKILPDLPREQNDQAFVKNLREIMLPTAAAFGILAIKDWENNEQRLKCGRIWQRIHLWGTMQGLAMQPLNQMCERVDREIQLGTDMKIGRQVRALLANDDWHAVMPFRLGYPTDAPNLSPRRGLDQVIL